jgi:SAM-dependent methyltransferase
VPTAFDRNRLTYTEAVDRAISFAGLSHDVYTAAKAQRLLELARRRLGRLPKDALDVGCGLGLTDSHLARHIAGLHGVDVSEEMVEGARERNPAVHYRSYDGRALPYETGRFELVFAICVLHHVEPDARAALLAELARVTRPQGLVAVFEHNPWNPLTRRVVRACAFDEGVRLLTRRRLAEGFRASGLIVTDAEYLLFSPWRTRAVVSLERRLSRVPAGAQYVVAGHPAG